MTAFWMAWGMFCAIPCPVKKWDQAKYPGMLLCTPLIGLLIGAIWAAFGYVAYRFHLGFVGAALLCALPSILSGFIHLDGYMDCADAVLSRRDLEKRREILKDSHVGSFAVICLALWLLFGFAAFAGMGLEKKWLCLLFLPAVSRSCSITAVLSFLPMSTSGYARLPESVKPYHKLLGIGETLLFCALAVIFCGRAGVCALVAALGSWVTILSIRKDLQGMSGDISGSAITVGELCGALALSLL